jgi:phage gpG-like protein
MAQITSVKIENNTEAVIEEMKSKMTSWLEAIGLDAASTAAGVAPVDTGRLKDSIGSAVVDNVVYIGTNVEYAPYQEFGTSKGVPGRHFLQFGATAHLAEYQALLEEVMKE